MWTRARSGFSSTKTGQQHARLDVSITYFASRSSMCGRDKNIDFPFSIFHLICKFSIFLEVNLKKSQKAFGTAHPEAAKLVGLAREMHALDLLTYHHGEDNLACLNISQSLQCMPLIASPRDHLPCLTCEAKLQVVTSYQVVSSENVCFGCPKFQHPNICIPNCCY